MDPIEITRTIIIERNITNMVYVWSGCCLVLFFAILWKMGLSRRAIITVWVSFLINIGWEMSMIVNGIRGYDSGYLFVPELVYHSFTELAPFVLFWLICLKLFGFIKTDKEYAEMKMKKDENDIAPKSGMETKTTRSAFSYGEEVKGSHRKISKGRSDKKARVEETTSKTSSKTQPPEVDK